MRGFNEINLYLFFDFLVRVFSSTCNNDLENTRRLSQLTHEEDMFLLGCRFWSMPNLYTEDCCRKGCIAHEPCRAYYFDDNNECALCVTEVPESNVDQQPAWSDVYIDLNKFEYFIAGKSMVYLLNIKMYMPNFRCLGVLVPYL